MLNAWGYGARCGGHLPGVVYGHVPCCTPCIAPSHDVQVIRRTRGRCEQAGPVCTEGGRRFPILRFGRREKNSQCYGLFATLPPRFSFRWVYRARESANPLLLPEATAAYDVSFRLTRIEVCKCPTNIDISSEMAACRQSDDSTAHPCASPPRPRSHERPHTEHPSSAPP